MSSSSRSRKPAHIPPQPDPRAVGVNVRATLREAEPDRGLEFDPDPATAALIRSHLNARRENGKERP